MDIPQARFDNRPSTAVDHHWDAADIVFTGDQAEITLHCGFAVQQCIVHIDVDDGCAPFDLLPSHLDRFFGFVIADEFGKGSRTGHVGPLADHQKIRIWPKRQWLRAAQTSPFFDA